MKRIILPVVILALVAVATFFIISKAQTRPDELDAKTQRELLDGYAKMMGNINTEKTGLPTAAQLEQASLVNPRHVLLVPLDKLKALDSTQLLPKIMSAGPSIFYEVRDAKGTIIAMMEVVSKDGKYSAASFGRKAMAQAIARQGANNPTGNIVRIQALHMDFLENGTGDNMTFTALQDIPDFDIRQGATYGSRELLSRVLPFVKSYNELPL
ncbi:MAG: hypothetical protein JST06_10795 [Bacteroidetes bacterium]|nr:hypothetical protein [Bacteroidota bacterium]MBS1629976.1 hypothetical protein [Bacteroidota bacterium]